MRPAALWVPALLMVGLLAGCSTATPDLTQEEKEKIGGRPPTSEELAKAMENAPSGPPGP